MIPVSSILIVLGSVAYCIFTLAVDTVIPSKLMLQVYITSAMIVLGVIGMIIGCITEKVCSNKLDTLAVAFFLSILLVAPLYRYEAVVKPVIIESDLIASTFRGDNEALILDVRQTFRSTTRLVYYADGVHGIRGFMKCVGTDNAPDKYALMGVYLHCSSNFIPTITPKTN